MKILITGAGGFIGRELTQFFSKKPFKLFCTNRKTLNPLIHSQVEDFFKSNKIDLVIHTAIEGGRRGQQEDSSTLHNNITMFNNLASFSNKYQFMFNFGSGAEFDRRENISIVKEEEVSNKLPSDYYGLSKNLITRKIVEQNDNIFNLRLFGCFGAKEEEQRLFKNTYNLLINGHSPVIHQNKYMDYFYVQDIGKVIERIVEEPCNVPRDINLCYEEKILLSEQVRRIKHLTKAKNEVIIENKEQGFSYTGDSKRLTSLGIRLNGLEKGMYECLINWNKF